jgi:hypothetical protein
MVAMGCFSDDIKMNYNAETRIISISVFVDFAVRSEGVSEEHP